MLRQQPATSFSECKITLFFLLSGLGSHHACSFMAQQKWEKTTKFIKIGVLPALERCKEQKEQFVESPNKSEMRESKNQLSYKRKQYDA